MSLKAPTHHIEAMPEDFAKTVIMPGDPLRSKHIAENYLENAVLVNNARYIQSYTGTYKGKRVSVMAHGIGMPSAGMYTWELYSLFGVENIIRVGTTGGLHPDLKIRDIVVAMGACTDSNWAKQYGLSGTFAPIASYDLMKTAIDLAEKRGLGLTVGNILSSDLFYSDEGDIRNQNWLKMGVLAVEMETAAIYMNAARFGKKALSLLTVSDHIITGEKTSAAERQSTFNDMLEIALDTAVAID